MTTVPGLSWTFQQNPPGRRLANDLRRRAGVWVAETVGVRLKPGKKVADLSAEVVDFAPDLVLLPPDGDVPEDIPDAQSPQVAEFISIVASILTRLQRQETAIRSPVEGNCPGAVSPK